MNDINQMNKTIERMKMEKQNFSQQFKEQGIKEGYISCHNMSYVNIIEIVKSSSIESTEVWNSWLEGYITEKMEAEPAFEGEAFLKGFLEGVSQFYQEVKEQLT